jgi:hypothetical protein
MYCTRCGSANLPNSKYCFHCGSPLLANTSNQTASSYQQAVHIDHRPVHKGGVFPRRCLANDEKILWEGKPSFLAFTFWPIVDFIIGVVWDMYIYKPGDPGLLNDMGAFFILIGVLGFILYHRSWRITAFALTDRRALVQYGVLTTKFAECRYDRINVSIVIKTPKLKLLRCGDMAFVTSGYAVAMSNAAAERFMANGEGIYWRSLPHPDEVKEQADAVVQMSRAQLSLSDPPRISAD